MFSTGSHAAVRVPYASRRHANPLAARGACAAAGDAGDRFADRQLGVVAMKETGLPVRGRSGWTVAAFTAVASAACALLALALGQDANYDQQNYHFYAPYALLNNRILYDIFPAFSGPTFTNPIPYLPFYWLAWNAPPILIGALLGALYGLAYAPLYLLARTVPPLPARRSGLAAMVLAALGLTGAVAIAESGTTFIDNLMSALVLSGLAVAAVAMPNLARASPMRAIMWAATAGSPVGLAAGFKITKAVHLGAVVLAAFVRSEKHPPETQAQSKTVFRLSPEKE